MTKAEEQADNILCKKCKHGQSKEYVCGMRRSKQYCVQTLNFILGYEQAEKDIGWISVKERLPEERKYESDNLQGHHEWTESDEVFVLDDRGFPMVDSLRNGKFRRDGHKDCDGFPHWIEYWMPIPKLPKK